MSDRSSKIETVVAVGLLLVAATVVAGADSKGIHISGGTKTGWAWVKNDGAGFRWDVHSNGYVSNGTNGAYSNAMQLRVNGAHFSWSSNGTVGKGGHEVEVGPWSNGPIRVWRRVYVDPKLGYCRWIDIFENTSGNKTKVSIQYETRAGSSIRMAHSSLGKTSVTDKDWALATGTSSSSRPAVLHVFASRGAKIRPKVTFTINNYNVNYAMTAQVSPNKMFALCFFGAQRNPYAKAVELVKTFDPVAELRKAPAPLRRIILNMGGALHTLGAMELPRDDKLDKIVLRNGDQLLGTLQNPSYAVETFYGKIDLPAGRILGIQVPSPNDPQVLLALVDGQVVAGKLLTVPLKIRLADGNEMSLQTGRIRSATYAVSNERPDSIRIEKPMVVLRDGQQLFFKPESVDYTYHTEYGRLKLQAANLNVIHMDTPAGGLHRAAFKNGSVLSGLMTAEQMSIALELGRTLEVTRPILSRLVFPSTDPPATGHMSQLVLRNDDRLLGEVSQETLTVRTGSGKLTLNRRRIAHMEFSEGVLGRVQVKLHDGTTVTGRLVEKTIGFQITPGPALKLFAGHVRTLTCPKPKEIPKTDKPTTQPATQPVKAK